jgi:hypothetical protein
MDPTVGWAGIEPPYHWKSNGAPLTPSTNLRKKNEEGETRGKKREESPS